MITHWPQSMSAPLAGLPARTRIAAWVLLLITWMAWSEHLGAVDMIFEDHPTVLNRESALKLIDVGCRAMIDSDTTPARAVDAALAFVKALQFFSTSGDPAIVEELNANIFWCKKRMNLDQIRSFLAAKGSDAEEENLIAKAAEIVTKAVDSSEAQAYFDRANTYAKENPTNFTQITSRYFEVAERFSGTDISIQAQRLSLAAQKKVVEQTKAKQEAMRATIFTRVAIPSAGREELAPPEGLNAAVATIRKQYKDEYAKRHPAQKRSLSRLFAIEAEDRSKPATMRHALYQEAVTLAIESKNYFRILKLADAMAEVFAVNAKEQKLAWLSKESGNAIAKAITTLLNTPLDPEANAVAGKELCFNENQWDEGIRVLVLGNDQALKTVADMEVLVPEGSAQQVELADYWHKLAGKASSSQKEQMIARSVYWYEKAQPDLKGFSKERVAKRLIELMDQLPYTKFTYAKGLTVKQWDRIPVKSIPLLATKELQDTGLVLTRGMRVRIVPHPTDTWNFDYGDYRWEGLSNIFDTNCWGGTWETKDNKPFYTSRNLTWENILMLSARSSCASSRARVTTPGCSRARSGPPS